jgi:hypothetical protein
MIACPRPGNPLTQIVISDAKEMTESAKEGSVVRIAAHSQGLRVRVHRAKSGMKSARVVIGISSDEVHPGSLLGIGEMQCGEAKDFRSLNC